MNTDLYNLTIELAKSTTLSPKDICASLKVTERWFYKFISGEIKNPGVHNVQALHDLLIADADRREQLAGRRDSDKKLGRRDVVTKPVVEK
jgi:hypothetical protein